MHPAVLLIYVAREIDRDTLCTYVCNIDNIVESKLNTRGLLQSRCSN